MQEAEDTGEHLGASQVVFFEEPGSGLVLVSAVSSSEAVMEATGHEDGYSVYMDVYYADGTTDYGYVLPFAVGTVLHQTQTGLILLERAVHKIELHLLFRLRLGRVRFHSVHLGFAGEGLACDILGRALDLPRPASASLEAPPPGAATLPGDVHLLRPRSKGTGRPA
eukprot:scaffold32_cov368-Prasinococcus_capsulatus_cf.AAC.3